MFSYIVIVSSSYVEHQSLTSTSSPGTSQPHRCSRALFGVLLRAPAAATCGCDVRVRVSPTASSVRKTSSRFPPNSLGPWPAEITSDRIGRSPSTKHAHGIRLNGEKKNPNDAAIVALRRSCWLGNDTVLLFLVD